MVLLNVPLLWDPGINSEVAIAHIRAPGERRTRDPHLIIAPSRLPLRNWPTIGATLMETRRSTRRYRTLQHASLQQLDLHIRPRVARVRPPNSICPPGVPTLPSIGRLHVYRRPCRNRKVVTRVRPCPVRVAFYSDPVIRTRH